MAESQKELFAYIGINKDGTVRAICRDERGEEKSTAKIVAEWIIMGRTIERHSMDVAMDRFKADIGRSAYSSDPSGQRRRKPRDTPPSRASGEAGAAQSPPDVAASAESLTEASNQNGGEADRTGVSTGPDNTTPQPEANLTAGADPLDIPPRLDRRQNGAQT